MVDTPMPEPVKESMRRFIAESRWTFAKTMPQWPHEYTVRPRRSNQDGLFAFDAEFCAFVLAIRQYGYKKVWGKRKFTYLDLDGWSYWTMGNPLSETTIINRAVQSDGG